MFSWLRKSPRPPPKSPANPGRGPTVKAAFANGERSWEESDNLVASLAGELSMLGHEVILHDEYLQLGDFTLLPQIVTVTPHQKGGMQTLTTIQVAHRELVPDGTFELQPSTGEDIRKSFAAGFNQWARVDLPVFLDALRAEAKDSLYLTMAPGRESDSALAPNRRVVMGPFSHFATEAASAEDAHPFCHCCLFTNSVEGFRDLLKGDDFYGIRLFASRDFEGQEQADCRVNGVEWSPGIERLRQYISKWPQRGFEFRKQYVVIQSMSPALSEAMKKRKAGGQVGAYSPGVGVG